MPSPDATFGRLQQAELAGLVLAALFALTFHLRLGGEMPSENDYREAAAAISAEAQAGDVVLLHPWWTERARLFLPESLPVVGYLGSDADPLDSHPRIWVLDQPHLPRAGEADFQRAFAPSRVRVGEVRRFGNLELALYRNDRSRLTLFSATQAVATAQVYLEDPGGRRVSCPFDGRVHKCPGPEWLHVGAEWHEVGLVPRRCLWMQPPGGNTRLVAEFANVLPGRLALEAGLVWDRGFHHDPGLTEMTVGVDDSAGNSLLKTVFPPHDDHLDKSARMLPQATGLKVWVQAPRSELKESCVEVLSQGPSQAEGP